MWLESLCCKVVSLYDLKWVCTHHFWTANTYYSAVVWVFITKYCKHGFIFWNFYSNENSVILITQTSDVEWICGPAALLVCTGPSHPSQNPIWLLWKIRIFSLSLFDSGNKRLWFRSVLLALGNNKASSSSRPQFLISCLWRASRPTSVPIARQRGSSPASLHLNARVLPSNGAGCRGPWDCSAGTFEEA